MYNQNRCMINNTDFGPEPFVVDIKTATLQNSNFRKALWTGEHLQLTLMCIPVGGQIGLESHPHLDQFLNIVAGCGCVMMGCHRYQLNRQTNVCRDSAIFIPAGTWHNLVNKGNCPIKLYSIYAPPQHPHGTIHKTKADADAAEEYH